MREPDSQVIPGRCRNCHTRLRMVATGTGPHARLRWVEDESGDEHRECFAEWRDAGEPVA